MMRKISLRAAAAALVAASCGLWTSPASAATIPGVGTVVKSDCAYIPKPCKRHIVAPSDGNGEVHLAGLAPGVYSVQVIGGREEAAMRVGRDGRLSFAAREEIKRPGSHAANQRPMPVVRRWAQPIAPRSDGIGLLLPHTAATIDLNTANSEELQRAAGNTPEAARAIVAEREQNGAFKGIEDFARRVCPSATVDFAQTSLSVGEQTILIQQGNAMKLSSFQCKPADNMFRLYAAWLSYTGHVTLLR